MSRTAGWRRLLGLSILPRRRILLTLSGVLIVSTLFSASFSFFSAFQSLSQGYLGEGENLVVFFSSQVRTFFTGSVPAYLAESLLMVDGVINTSPEILTAAIVRDQTVFIRGVTSRFFDIQPVSFLRGETQQLQEGGCIAGLRAAHRLGLNVGDRIIVISSIRRNVLKELRVEGIFSSNTPMDDEILAPVESTRFLAFLPDRHVTLIRAEIDRAKVDEAGLRSIVSQHHTLRVEVAQLNTSIPSKAYVKVLDQADRQISVKRIDVPGAAVFKLPFGLYKVKVADQQCMVTLTSDTELNLKVDLQRKRLGISVRNATNSLPLEGAKVAVMRTDGVKASETVTDAAGEACFILPLEEYSVSVEHGGRRAVKEVDLNREEEASFLLGRIRLNVVVLNASTRQPLEGAWVYVSDGVSTAFSETTDVAGRASFLLEPGLYNVSVSTPLHHQRRMVDLTGDPTVTFLLGPSPPVYNLTVKVFWANGTAVPDAWISVEGETFKVEALTGPEGAASFESLPEGDYTLSVDRLGYSKELPVTLDGDIEVPVTLPTPLSIPRGETSPQWVRYLPQRVMVEAPKLVLDLMTQYLIRVVRAAILILAALVTLTAALSGWDIASTSIAESRETIGALRAIGATRGQTTILVCLRVTIFSALTGAAGYLIGLASIGMIARTGVLTAGGYIFQPCYEWRTMLATVGLSVLVATAASLRTTLKAIDRPPMELLRRLYLRDFLQLPKVGELKTAILAFLAPLLIRAVPEILMKPHPVGFDTLSLYIPVLGALEKGLEELVWEALRLRPFFWAVATLPYPWDSLAPFKAFPALLHGLLGLASYAYARGVFKSRGKALAASLLSTLYFIPLRVSWDLISNEFGLVLVFTSLALLRESGRSWGRTLLAMASMTAAVLTHEGASMLLFLAAFPAAISQARRRGDGSRIKLAASLLPPLALYIYQLVSLDLSLLGSPMGGWWYPSDTYWEMAESVARFFLYCNLPLLPLALLGIKGEADAPSLRAWALGSSAAALLPVISPNVAFAAWQRWAFMSAYPLAYYAVEGVDRLKRFRVGLRPSKKKPRSLDLRLPVGVTAGLLLGMLSLGFVAMPPRAPLQYFDLYGTERNWILLKIPPSMQLNTLPLDEASEAVTAIVWLNENAGRGGCLLADVTFRGFASIHLDYGRLIWYDLDWGPYRYPGWAEDAGRTAEKFRARGLDVYLIWYRSHIPGFEIVYYGDRVAIYRYQGV